MITTKVWLRPNTTRVVIGAPNPVAGTQAAPVVKVFLSGPPGPKGDPGTDATLVFNVTAVSSWHQTHSLPYPPVVRLVDPAGFAVDVGVEYPDSSSVHIEFPTPFTGRIILS